MMSVHVCCSAERVISPSSLTSAAHVTHNQGRRSQAGTSSPWCMLHRRQFPTHGRQSCCRKAGRGRCPREVHSSHPGVHVQGPVWDGVRAVCVCVSAVCVCVRVCETKGDAEASAQAQHTILLCHKRANQPCRQNMCPMCGWRWNTYCHRRHTKRGGAWTAPQTQSPGLRCSLRKVSEARNAHRMRLVSNKRECRHPAVCDRLELLCRQAGCS